MPLAVRQRRTARRAWPQHGRLNRTSRFAPGLVFAALGQVLGSAVCRDASPWRNHAAVLNAGANWIWAPERGRFALDMDGANDRIDLSFPLVLPDNTPWTIAIGCYPDSLGTDGLYGYDYTTAKYTCFYYTAAPSMRLRNDANTEVTWYPANFAVGQWHDLVLACNGANSSNVQLWINGVSAGTKTLADSSQTITRLGTYGGTLADRGIDGRIDYFAVWNGLRLTPGELLGPTGALLEGLLLEAGRRVYPAPAHSVSGPYRIAAAQAFSAGRQRAQVFVSGALKGQIDG